MPLSVSLSPDCVCSENTKQSLGKKGYKQDPATTRYTHTDSRTALLTAAAQVSQRYLFAYKQDERRSRIVYTSQTHIADSFPGRSSSSSSSSTTNSLRLSSFCFVFITPLCFPSSSQRLTFSRIWHTWKKEKKKLQT